MSSEMDLIDFNVIESVEDSILRTKSNSSRTWLWNLIGLAVITVMLLALYLTREPEPESGVEKTQRMINESIKPSHIFSTFLF
jgi:hypothetical protein